MSYIYAINSIKIFPVFGKDCTHNSDCFSRHSRYICSANTCQCDLNFWIESNGLCVSRESINNNRHNVRKPSNHFKAMLLLDSLIIRCM